MPSFNGNKEWTIIFLFLGLFVPAISAGEAAAEAKPEAPAKVESKTQEAEKPGDPETSETQAKSESPVTVQEQPVVQEQPKASDTKTSEAPVPENKTSETKTSETKIPENKPEPSTDQSVTDTIKTEADRRPTSITESKTKVSGDKKVSRMRVQTILGVSIIQGAAFTIGTQGGWAPFKDKTIFLGPEITYSRFSSGSSINALLTGWYETRVYGSPRLSVSFGGAAGAALVSDVSGLPSTALALFLDTALAQDVSDSMSVRAQFRPGLVGQFFAFMMNFNVVFRL